MGTVTKSGAGARRWLAAGTGVGIEIADGQLRVAIARVRPSGVAVLGATTIERFRERPAADWGGEIAAFVKRHAGAALPATVLLPRREVIVRVLQLPGVPDKELAAAIQFQVESLHPWGEDDAAFAWGRLGAPGAVLVALIRRDALERYIALFNEAGVKASHFTFSASALYGTARLLAAPPAGVVAIAPSYDGYEIYGESEARPVFSAAFDTPAERAVALAAAELRLEPEAVDIATLLPKPKRAPADFDAIGSALAYAAALAGACPRLARPVNLLPPEFRKSTSRWRYVPTGIAAALLMGAAVSLAAVRPIEDRKYLRALQAEIARLEPQARKAAVLDRAIEAARTRARLLDQFRSRSKADLDLVQEITHLVEAPAWLGLLELTRTNVTVGGQADQAGPLLKILDGSPHLEGAEFTLPLSRTGKQEVFRIRAAREGAPQ